MMNKYRQRKRARYDVSVDLIVNSGLPFRAMDGRAGGFATGIVFDFGNGVKYYPSSNVCLIGTRRMDFNVKGTAAFIEWFKKEYKLYLSGV